MSQQKNNTYSLELVLEVDSEANFLELSNGDNIDVIEDIIKDLIYDVDDIKCVTTYCERID